ncbi:MAG TPA: 2-polyprenylphenol 6-hydroxylase [Xanthobacteraceae bacterium]|nr:2-polyprenylphenol 6-hydroxylase [Xanthobacteraceae bacterium]
MSGVFHLLRLAHAGFVLAREGVLALVDPAAVPPGPRLLLRLGRLIERRNAGSGAVRLAVALTRLGPSYVKLGQFLATRPDIVGATIARDLETLQDRMPPFSQAEAEAAVAEGLGQPLTQLFEQFGPAVAAASIAQVHRADVKHADGTRSAVAVKVLRPHIEYRFQRDLDSFLYIARLAERHSAEARRLRLISVVETLARSVAIEMDLRLEAAAFSELAENTRDNPDFRVPAVDWERTARRVLTVEWVDGIPLSDRAALLAAGHDPVRLARVLIQSFLQQAIGDGFFHADLHPGNLFVDAKGRLVAVDCGIMGRLGPKERKFLAEILFGFITRDWKRTAEIHFEAGYVPSHHSIDDFAQAIRAIGEPIHDRRADEISMAKLLTLLFEVTAIFDMRTRPELLLLQKTMVVAEGVARSLDPKLDMWSTAEPVVRAWIERHLGPIGKIEDAAQELGALGRLIGQAPSLLSRAAGTIERFDEQTRDGLVLSPETVDAIGRAEARRWRWTAAALWVIAALIALWIFR